jgi:hypothetical protein
MGRFMSWSQIANLKRGQIIKYLPLAFTEHGAILATLHTRDFAGIPGLVVEDWSAPSTTDQVTP